MLSVYVRCSLLALGILAAVGANAQTTPPKSPTFVRIIASQVKPEMQTEWIDFMKNEAMPAYKKAGIKHRSVWQGGPFGDPSSFVSATTFTNFADLDSEPALAKALGEEGMAQFMAHARKCLNGSRHYALRLHEDLSLQKRTSGPPAYAIVTHIRVVQGRRGDFMRFIKNEVLPVMRKAEIENYWVQESIFGGNASEWTTLILQKKFAELDRGNIFVRVLGEPGADKLLLKTTGLITGMERFLARYRADLSYSME